MRTAAVVPSLHCNGVLSSIPSASPDRINPPRYRETDDDDAAGAGRGKPTAREPLLAAFALIFVTFPRLPRRDKSSLSPSPSPTTASAPAVASSRRVYLNVRNFQLPPPRRVVKLTVAAQRAWVLSRELEQERNTERKGERNREQERERWRVARGRQKEREGFTSRAERANPTRIGLRACRRERRASLCVRVA